MIQEVQKYIISQRINLDKLFAFAKKIEKKRNVVVIERNKIIQELNKAKTIIHFLQNDLTKQQNQSSIDQLLQSMKTHSFVIISVFIDLNASKAIKSVKLFDEKTTTNNDENEFVNWLNEIKNKFQNNVNWYSIEISKIDYVKSQLIINDDIVKHIQARLRFDDDKFFKTIEEVLQMWIKMYENLNKKNNV